MDVQSKPEGLKEMMKWTKGRRDVPVIVENGKATIGFGGS